jgi:hypothetical protein
VALGNGFAFIADGTSGLQVVNYLARDVGGVAPTVTLDTTGLDTNPGRAGIQVLEGSIISLHATVRDDVQVSDVQVLRDGVALPADPSYPWDLRVALPTLDAGATQVTLQVRATDTGGNLGLSAPLVIELVRDEIAPTITFQNITSGASITAGSNTFRFTFSEALKPESVTPASFHLIGANGVELQPQSLTQVDSGKGVNFTYAGLDLGTYHFKIDANEVTDRAGNALGATVIDIPFSVIAGPVNGDFENGLDSWNALGNVISTTSAYEGQHAALLSNASPASVSTIETSLGLPSGAFNLVGGTSATNGSALYQDMFLKAGQGIGFAWRFSTSDYLPYNDFSAVFAISDGASTYSSRISSISTVGSYGDSGWQTKTLTVDHDGTYKLIFAVANSNDTAVESRLFIDHVFFA